MGHYDLIQLSPQEMDNLLYAIDGSLKVNRRFQFFLWSQGGLQSLIPHETMICAWGDIDGMRFKYEVFTRLILDDGFVAGLADPIDGLLPRLIDAWRRKERQICAYEANQEDGEDALSPRLRTELARLGIERIVVHGAREMKGSTGSFFVFLNGNGAPSFSTRDAYLMELLMPHLHMTVHRLVDDGDGAPLPTALLIDAVLSGREAQVLKWVREGKTNQEIAQILDISPLTVKNHVQKILRKLKVTNRAQAVAKGIASRLIPDREAV